MLGRADTVRGKIHHPNPVPFKRRFYIGSVVSAKVIHKDNVAAFEPWSKILRDPCNKALTRHGALHGFQDHRTRCPNSVHHRDISPMICGAVALCALAYAGPSSPRGHGQVGA